MKKIFLLAYVRKNLGDDLFIKLLTEEYPMFEFFLKVDKDEFTDNLKNIKNLNITISENLFENLCTSNVNDFDACIYIGGSIFMEKGRSYDNLKKLYEFIKKCKSNNKPFFYISCNYGPYKTEEYLNHSKKMFAECEDVCFRDTYSYNLFKEIDSIRYAPDFAFNYDYKKIEKIKNSIGISVIDLSIRPEFTDIQDEYIELLIKNIKKFLNLGKKVYLYSFCKYEGDEKTIDKILSHFNNCSNIIDVRYDGDLEETLHIYKKMQYMICSRFHSVILSTIFRQKIFILSYSDKINNVINDLGFELPLINLSEIKSNLELNLSKFKVCDKRKLQNAIIKSKGQKEVINRLLV